MDDWHEGVVLLDVPPGAEGEFDREMLERMGHPVLVCHGPEAETTCPLLTGQGCPLFEQAHGIVFKLDTGVEQHRAIVERYRQLARPGLPIRVMVPGSAPTAPGYPATSSCGPTSPRSPSSTGSPPRSRPPTGSSDRRAPAFVRVGDDTGGRQRRGPSAGRRWDGHPGGVVHEWSVRR